MRKREEDNEEVDFDDFDEDEEYGEKTVKKKSGNTYYITYNYNNGQKGKGAAEASLVFGILSIVCWFFGWTMVFSLIFGLIGALKGHKAKTVGYRGSMRTAGSFLSIIGLLPPLCFCILLIIYPALGH